MAVQHAHGDGEGGGSSGFFHAAQRRGCPVQAGVAGENGQRTGGLAREFAGRAVGPEAERADGVLDPVTGGIGHGAMPVDHTGDHLVRDSRYPCHVADGYGGGARGVRSGVHQPVCRPRGAHETGHSPVPGSMTAITRVSAGPLTGHNRPGEIGAVMALDTSDSVATIMRWCAVRTRVRRRWTRSPEAPGVAAPGRPLLDVSTVARASAVNAIVISGFRGSGCSAPEPSARARRNALPSGVLAHRLRQPHARARRTRSASARHDTPGRRALADRGDRRGHDELQGAGVHRALRQTAGLLGPLTVPTALRGPGRQEQPPYCGTT